MSNTHRWVEEENAKSIKPKYKDDSLLLYLEKDIIRMEINRNQRESLGIKEEL